MKKGNISILLFTCGIVVFETLWIVARREDLIRSPNHSKTDELDHRENMPSQKNTDASPIHSHKPRPPPQIHVAAVICGDRAEEGTTMLKSITLFTKRQLYFHILAEGELHHEIKSVIDAWPIKEGQVVYKVYSLKFPQNSSDEWKRLFVPCATQRLFFPSILKHVDSVIYLDTDCLVLRPIEDVWQHFLDFNSTQLAAATPEGGMPEINWYIHQAKHPYYGQSGINSGVMLMNLTRMRSHPWEEQMQAIYKKHKHVIPWGDQDILNIHFHYHPDLLYLLTCEWNLRSDHCSQHGRELTHCKTAETNGISVLHGNRRIFHGSKTPVFKAVYDAVREYQHGHDVAAALVNLRQELVKFNQTHCGALKDAIHPWKTTSNL